MRKYFQISIVIHCIIAVVAMFTDGYEMPSWVRVLGYIALLNAIVVFWLLVVIYEKEIVNIIDKFIDKFRK